MKHAIRATKQPSIIWNESGRQSRNIKSLISVPLEDKTISPPGSLAWPAAYGGSTSLSC